MGGGVHFIHLFSLSLEAIAGMLGVGYGVRTYAGMHGGWWMGR